MACRALDHERRLTVGSKVSPARGAPEFVLLTVGHEALSAPGLLSLDAQIALLALAAALREASVGGSAVHADLLDKGARNGFGEGHGDGLLDKLGDKHTLYDAWGGVRVPRTGCPGPCTPIPEGQALECGVGSAGVEAASPHPREEERLAELHRLDILDTDPEEDFDDLVKLAATLADVPIALVSLVDEDRQWFKACIGLDVSQTGRDVAFCSHAILTPHSPFVVPDTLEARAFHDNPLVTGAPFIRFYAGFPLVGRSGLPFGTLCVIDTKPRKLETRISEALEALARQASLAMEHRALLADVAEERKRRLAAISRIAHDVAGPLLPLAAVADELPAGQPKQRLMEVHAWLSSFATDLRKLANGMDGRALKLEQLNLGDLVGAVVEDFRSRIDRDIEFRGYPAWVQADADRIRSVVHNLLSNADHHGAGRISVDVVAGDMVEIIVRDQGGFRPGDEQRMFDAFQRDGDAQGIDTGMGLGLHICRETVEAHGGRLTAHSDGVGTGATFRVALPSL